jgi:mycothiol system anti-sigma-R factor
VLADVYLYLDDQLDAQRFATLKQHLDDCSPCLREYGLEEHVRALVARCCRDEVAPDGLRTKVLARLETIRTEVTVIVTEA